ncbi:MAG: hypothetical protein LBP93_05990 [Treponema sp.]|jgi:hypothetical protein|nr:hypothetical protein [Treponema sp.]
MANTSAETDQGEGAKRKRRLLIRSILGILWIGLGSVLFVTNRAHTLLVDNRNVQEINLRAPDLITVSIDGQPALEFLRGDRDRLIVKGINHRIRVEFSDGTAPFEGGFKLPLRGDMYLLSVPRMIKGIEPFVEVFHSAPEPRSPEEEELPQPEEAVPAP